MSIKKLATAIIALGLVTSASAAKLTAVDKSKTTELCITAASGKLAAMHNTIKSSGYSTKFIVDKVQCNGESLLSFIEQNGKNPASMLKMLDRRQTLVTITDLASNSLHQK
jgi:hypothetical protein